MSSYGYFVYASDKPFTSLATGSPRLPNTTHFEEWFSTYYRLQDKAAKGQLDQLSNKDCISAYATAFQSKHGSLLIQTDDFNSTAVDVRLLASNDDLQYTPGYDPYAWICTLYQTSEYQTHLCSSLLPEISSDLNSWSVTYTRGGDDLDNKYTANSCWSERLPDLCKVEYSLVWTVIVIVCNVVKAGILCGISVCIKDMPILTTGDAVVSLLRDQDWTTKGECLSSRQSVVRDIRGQLRFTKRSRRWASAVSRSRWWVCMALFSTSITACILLLSLGLMGVSDRTTIWKSGIGTANGQTIIRTYGFPTTLLPNTLIVNTPQTIFSLIYFTTNAIFSIMLLSAEWNSYALHRKGLRVSTGPKGSQRSTYFLSLPYRYALPLLALSTLLHWLISQSLFLVNVEMYDATLTRDPQFDIISCGYSPLAIVICLSVSGVLIAYLVGMGCRRFKSGMPIAGSCSAAISAACHFDVKEMMESAPRNDSDSQVLLHESQPVETLPLQWGVVPFYGGEVGHCAFSSVEVETPKDGDIYE
ncbi:hypothetical protein MW887_006523 [Aspergillus wentii]|nr:hypothetical protein MW887_006523 [Aspergillus wentii]